MRPKSTQPVLDKILHIRVTSVEYKELVDLAKKFNRTPSAYYRDKLKAILG